MIFSSLVGGNIYSKISYGRIVMYGEVLNTFQLGLVLRQESLSALAAQKRLIKPIGRVDMLLGSIVSLPKSRLVLNCKLNVGGDFHPKLNIVRGGR